MYAYNNRTPTDVSNCYYQWPGSKQYYNSITNITCIINISSIADIMYIPALPQLSIFQVL